MSCIGEEIVKDASRIPIVDVIDSCDIITNSTVLQVCLFICVEKHEDYVVDL